MKIDCLYYNKDKTGTDNAHLDEHYDGDGYGNGLYGKNDGNNFIHGYQDCDNHGDGIGYVLDNPSMC